MQVHGRGVSVYASGNRYDGEWMDGKINGVGVLTYSDGDRFEGDWKDGKMHGKGKLLNRRPHFLVTIAMLL